MNEHVYVLGSNSFSGAHFVDALLEKGYAVTGISRSPEYPSVFLPYLQKNGAPPRNFNFYQADINHNLNELMEKMEHDKPEYIVNFAAQGMVAESWQHPEQWLLTNTVSPVKLYDKLRKVSWLKKFVQISTPEVYGSTGGLVSESFHYEPSTPYAVSKAAADMNLMCYHRAYDFPVVFTRAANVFGPCQQLYRIIPRTVLKFLTGGILELHGGGHSTRAFIHIRDVADATLRIMVSADPGEVFHISTNRMISIRSLVFLIAQRLGVDAEKHIKIVGDRLGKDAAYLLDSNKLRNILNWQEIYTLEQGIDDVIAWVRNNLEELSSLPQEYCHKP